MLLPPGTTGSTHESDHAEGDALERAALSAGSLHDLLPEFVLFTLLPVYCCSTIDYDPVQRYVNTCGADNMPRVCTITFDEPIFDSTLLGPEPRLLDHLLLACERRHWAALLRDMTSTALHDPSRNTFAKFMYSSFLIVDQLSYQRRGWYPGPPDVPIFSLGLDADYGCFQLEPTAQVGVRPKLRRQAALDSTREQARKFKGEVA